MVARSGARREGRNTSKRARSSREARLLREERRDLQDLHLVSLRERI
jgi:hypothetical protein